MNTLNYDLNLQLVEYLNANFLISWFKLLQLNKNLYPEYLYNLRKNRYVLTADEINKLQEYLIKLPNDINEGFIAAAGNGYLNVVKYLYLFGINTVGTENDYILLPLRWAIGFDGRLEVVKYETKYGPNINARNNRTLQVAAANGHLKVIKYLVSQGVDANNNWALQIAAQNGHFDVVKYLIEKGANVVGVNAYNALQLAAISGHLKIVKYLVHHGVDTNVVDAMKDYALRWAARNGYLNVVKYLIEKGANIHAEDDYALRLAAEFRHLNVVEYLIEQGANVNVLTVEQKQKYTL